MAFLEDPRLRQRWNQIAHDAEAVTENAAAGIWSIKEHYLTPCVGYLTDSIEQCTTVCLGDPEDRLRRRRERNLAQERAEFGFDFYDDWYDEEEQGGSFFGTWAGEDWDRLLAGTGSQRKRSGIETTEQPRRKRGMSYGTRGARRKASENDPTIIPSTQPIGFLSKLPWKVGGTLRYKPSAADLQDHPGKPDVPQDHETEPLLLSDEESDYGELVIPRQRSGTAGSGDTSDSYRSRGDLFPSDGEGDEDAVALDDDVTYDMVRKDDRSTRSDRTRSSKGKRPAARFSGSRTVSKTTLNSTSSYESLSLRRNSSSLPVTPGIDHIPSLQDLHLEEQRLQEEEEDAIMRKKEAAKKLAVKKRLQIQSPELSGIEEYKLQVEADEQFPRLENLEMAAPKQDKAVVASEPAKRRKSSKLKALDSSIIQSLKTRDDFIPARLPNFG